MATSMIADGSTTRAYQEAKYPSTRFLSVARLSR
jgi:hypothetical protein